MRLFLSRSFATVRTLCRTEQSPPLFVLHQEQLITDRARLFDLRRPVVVLRSHLSDALARFRAVLLVQNAWLHEDTTAARAGLLQMSFRRPVRVGWTPSSVDEAVLFMCQHLQVFRAIIVALVVAVMDLFLLSKRPAEHLAGNQSVLQDIAGIHRVWVFWLLQHHIAIAPRNSTSRPAWIPSTTGPAIPRIFHHRRVYL